MDFRDWLAAELGTSKWVVAPRLTARLGETYDLAISRKTFTSLRETFLAKRRIADTIARLVAHPAPAEEVAP